MKWINFLEEKFALIFALKTILHFLSYFVFFVAAQILSSLLIDEALSDLFLGAFQPVGILFEAILTVGLFIFFARIYTIKVLKLDLLFFRIPKVHTTRVWVAISLILPLVVIGVYLLFANLETIETGTKINGITLLNHIFVSVFAIGLVSGITEEILFRGFLMRLLEKRWNIIVAIFIPSVVFGLIHLIDLPSIGVIDVLLLFIVGTAVGVTFSLITYFSGNIWNAVLVHSVWNILIGAEIIKISQTVSLETPALLKYKVLNESFLWTGGSFGIEVALPATLSYLLLILLMFVFKKRLFGTPSASSV